MEYNYLTYLGLNALDGILPFHIYLAVHYKVNFVCVARPLYIAQDRRSIIFLVHLCHIVDIYMCSAKQSS